jgi:hypothetical protein
MKKKLQSKLYDGDLRGYQLEREEWTDNTLDKIAWEAYGTAFRRLSRNRKITISKACYNLWHNGVCHQYYYQEV